MASATNPLLKSSGDYSPGRNSARAENPSPVYINSLKKSHVIETKFQPELKSELGHTFSTPF